MTYNWEDTVDILRLMILFSFPALGKESLVGKENFITRL